MVGGMEKTTLYLPGELQRDLKAAARRQRRPQAVLVREALRDYLAADAATRPRPKSIGIASAGRVSAADSEAWIQSEWDRELLERRSQM